MASQIVRVFHGFAPIPILFVALVQRSWLPIVLYLSAASLAHVLILMHAPLYALSQQQVVAEKRGRKTIIALLFAFAAVVVAVGFFSTANQ